MSLLLRGLRNKRTSYAEDTLLTRMILQFRVYKSPYQEYRAGFEVHPPEKLLAMATLSEAVAAQDWDFLDHVLLRHPDLDISKLELGREVHHHTAHVIRIWQENQQRLIQEKSRRHASYGFITAVCFIFAGLNGSQSWFSMGLIAMGSIVSEKLLYVDGGFCNSYLEVRQRYS